MMFEIGQRVVYAGTQHHAFPNHFPKVGTVGFVTSIDTDGDLWVQWEKGSTSLNDCWCVSTDEVRFTEGELYRPDSSKLKHIDAVPTIHAHWELEHESYGEMRCSNCKKEALTKEDKASRELLYVMSDYCPYCGARMDEATLNEI